LADSQQLFSMKRLRASSSTNDLKFAAGSDVDYERAQLTRKTGIPATNIAYRRPSGMVATSAFSVRDAAHRHGSEL
jgi:hypothetical protein